MDRSEIALSAIRITVRRPGRSIRRVGSPMAHKKTSASPKERQRRKSMTCFTSSGSELFVDHFVRRTRAKRTPESVRALVTRIGVGGGGIDRVVRSDRFESSVARLD